MLDLKFNDVPLVTALHSYESGQMDEDEQREFLAFLADNGLLEHLQESYTRAYLATL